MYLFARGIDFADFYDLSIGLGNSSDNIHVVFIFIFTLGTVNFKKIFLINHVSTETPTTRQIIASGTNSPSVDLSTQSYM